ncbi:MAG: ATP-binding protein [Acidobacteriota bacterium]
MNSITTIPNPFRSAIVADPWHWGQWDMVDVPEIHQEAFDLCRRALEQTRHSHRSTSILLHGDAGSGKTHLLARLQAWLAGELKIYGAAPPAIFISVRMQTSPQMIWRHLQSRFGEDLLRSTANGRTQLERILLPRLAEFSPAIGEPWLWLERIQREARTTPQAAEEAEQVIDALDQSVGLNDRDLTIVLTHLILGRHRRDVRAWLRGESLPEAALAQLGLRIDPEGDPEERARTLVLSLCRLTGPAMPIVFCFDQVEALQSHPHDLAGLHRFGQMLGFLHDETENTLLISCILSIFIDSLNKAIISSDYDRMRSFGHLPLMALTPPEAKRLVEARLNSTPGLQSWRAAHPERFWPLSEETIDAALRRNINTPRALLSYCADQFELNWRPELHLQRPSNHDFLTQEMEERLERAAATVSPEQTGLILAHGLPLLLRIVDPRWERGATAPLKGVDLVIESELGRVVLSLCNQNNMTTLASHLRRLRDQMVDRVLEDGGRDRHLLIRDVRMPISSHARKTREYREELLTLGFHWIGVTAEMITALDGARCLLSEAKAGDLANGVESISEQEVQQWLLANLTTRLRPLHELLEMVLPTPWPLAAQPPAPQGGAAEAEFNLCEDMSELLAFHHLLSVEYLSMRLDREPETIEQCARRHPERFGLLTGPPAVLFQPTLEALRNDESSAREGRAGSPLGSGH